MDRPADNPQYTAMSRSAFGLARQLGCTCGPAHLLIGLSEGDGPVAAALVPTGGSPLRSFVTAADGTPGGAVTHVNQQAQQGARQWAQSRGEALRVEHLAVVLIDQAAPDTVDLLTRAGVDGRTVRRAALESLSAPLDLPAVALPAFTPGLHLRSSPSSRGRARSRGLGRLVLASEPSSPAPAATRPGLGRPGELGDGGGVAGHLPAPPRRRPAPLALPSPPRAGRDAGRTSPARSGRTVSPPDPFSGHGADGQADAASAPLVPAAWDPVLHRRLGMLVLEPPGGAPQPVVPPADIAVLPGRAPARPLKSPWATASSAIRYPSWRSPPAPPSDRWSLRCGGATNRRRR